MLLGQIAQLYCDWMPNLRCRYYLMNGHCLPCIANDLTKMRRANTAFLYLSIIATAVLPTILLTYW